MPRIGLTITPASGTGITVGISNAGLPNGYNETLDETVELSPLLVDDAGGAVNDVFFDFTGYHIALNSGVSWTIWYNIPAGVYQNLSMQYRVVDESSPFDPIAINYNLVVSLEDASGTTELLDDTQLSDTAEDGSRVSFSIDSEFTVLDEPSVFWTDFIKTRENAP